MPRGIFSSLIWSQEETHHQDRPAAAGSRAEAPGSGVRGSYLQVGDPALALPPAAVGIGGGGGGGGRARELVGGDAARVPVGPEDAVGLDVQVHGVDTHAGVALEGLLVAPVGHPGVQAADLVVVSDVEDLATAVHVCREKSSQRY